MCVIVPKNGHAHEAEGRQISTTNTDPVMASHGPFDGGITAIRPSKSDLLILHSYVE